MEAIHWKKRVAARSGDAHVLGGSPCRGEELGGGGGGLGESKVFHGDRLFSCCVLL